jgi:hypothetical protein
MLAPRQGAAAGRNTCRNTERTEECQCGTVTRSEIGGRVTFYAYDDLLFASGALLGGIDRL